MADNKNPTPGEIVIIAAGAVALIGSFLAFYKFDGFGGSSSTSAWGSGLFPVATLGVIFVVIMALHIVLTKFANLSLPDRVLGFTWEQIHLVLGFFATVYAVAYLLQDKAGLSFGIGYWLILLASIAALVGAVLLQKERGSGTL